MFTKFIRGNIMDMIEFYRFISILLTLSIYVLKGIYEHYSYAAILLLLLCVIAFTLLISYLYKKSYSSAWRLHLLLAMEIIGISLLILLTGGLKSPFIWCFLNPMLMISYYMSPRQKFIYLGISLILLTIMGYYVDKHLTLLEYFMNNLNIILSFILLLILFNILFKYSRQIMDKKNQLQAANKSLELYNERIKGMTQDILYMYEAVNTISGQRGKIEIVHVLMDFVERASPECIAFYLSDDISGLDSLISSDEIRSEIKSQLISEYKNNLRNIRQKQVFGLLHSEGYRAIICKLSGVKKFGAIGLLVKESEYEQRKSEYESIILLGSQLGATFFEKSETETVDRELAVAYEQNRIADDIHDSVIQRLFASSCFAYDALKKWDSITDGDKKEQMTKIMENVQSSLKDLRSTIYNLSSKKQQINFFTDSISSYLLELEGLTGIKIYLDISGDPDSLSFSAKKALYRIIIECTGNAIKHSGCTSIWVDFNIGEEKTRLSVKDDGIGFDIDKAHQERNGLGLYNIKSLIRRFNGSYKICSEEKAGTTFIIEFLNQDIKENKDED